MCVWRCWRVLRFDSGCFPPQRHTTGRHRTCIIQTQTQTQMQMQTQMRAGTYHLVAHADADAACTCTSLLDLLDLQLTGRPRRRRRRGGISTQQPTPRRPHLLPGARPGVAQHAGGRVGTDLDEAAHARRGQLVEHVEQPVLGDHHLRAPHLRHERGEVAQPLARVRGAVLGHHLVHHVLRALVRGHAAAEVIRVLGVRAPRRHDVAQRLVLVAQHRQPGGVAHRGPGPAEHGHARVARGGHIVVGQDEAHQRLGHGVEQAARRQVATAHGGLHVERQRAVGHGAPLGVVLDAAQADLDHAHRGQRHLAAAVQLHLGRLLRDVVLLAQQLVQVVGLVPLAHGHQAEVVGRLHRLAAPHGRHPVLRPLGPRARLGVRHRRHVQQCAQHVHVVAQLAAGARLAQLELARRPGRRHHEHLARLDRAPARGQPMHLVQLRHQLRRSGHAGQRARAAALGAGAPTHEVVELDLLHVHERAGERGQRVVHVLAHAVRRRLHQ
mmetsp:Transcript_27856/g.89801  ORF Transcript_27856/g.89801 Transcript_27856/m.89801 type:complete len:496 (-) Transcript_27856:2222-3709(-)